MCWTVSGTPSGVAGVGGGHGGRGQWVTGEGAVGHGGRGQWATGPVSETNVTQHSKIRNK